MQRLTRNCRVLDTAWRLLLLVAFAAVAGACDDIVLRPAVPASAMDGAQDTYRAAPTDGAAD